MTPGPAFIPAQTLLGSMLNKQGDRVRIYEHHEAPEGYIWQPATESTGAGWVRPLGEPICCPHGLRLDCSDCEETRE